MTFSRLVLTLVFSVFMASAASAAPVAQSNALPNMISIGGGWFDVTKNTPRNEAADFRLEHRWGVSLLPLADNYFNSWDEWFQIHPFVGVETTSKAQLYGFGGFIFDVLLGKHVVLSPNVVVGFYERGDGKRLGSVIEFRSTLEAGWRFDNEMRLTGYFGHISNAGIGDINPGAETAGVYLHIPTRVLFGN